eukprot:1158580-Pelagomonas_calceolata.AAC.16
MQRKAVVTAVVIAAGIHADVCCSNVCSPGGELGGSPPACALPRKFRAAVGSLVLRLCAPDWLAYGYPFYAMVFI